MLLEKIKTTAKAYPQKLALVNKNYADSNVTYAELDEQSTNLAYFINHEMIREGETPKTPIIVYGHKNPYMIVTFLACVKAGYPYCPVDISMPAERITDIINDVQPKLVFALQAPCFETADANIICLDEIKALCKQQVSTDSTLNPVANDDLFYILFTSGSTGRPKGVKITYSCLNNFLTWTSSIAGRYCSSDPVFLNQAPFSFDLSVMDLYTSLYTGGTLYILDKDLQINFPMLIDALSKSEATVWVSTPSFAEMCLSDKKFAQALLPKLKAFLFCGEILTNSTALKLIDRFPQAEIINTYGPTESTVAVTEQKITKELADKDEPLPIGKAKNGTFIEIWDETGKPCAIDQTGEIVIIGDTVAAGYFNNNEATLKAFLTVNKNGIQHKAYKSGDRGFCDRSGILHYVGRKDNQIKLNGYRIETGDIEKNILKLEMVTNAAVVPKYKDAKVRYLAAFVTLNANKGEERENISLLKNRLREILPDYMIPKKWHILDTLPMNANGKIDKKKLEGMI